MEAYQRTKMLFLELQTRNFIRCIYFCIFVKQNRGKQYHQVDVWILLDDWKTGNEAWNIKVQKFFFDTKGLKADWVKAQVQVYFAIRRQPTWFDVLTALLSQVCRVTDTTDETCWNPECRVFCGELRNHSPNFWISTHEHAFDCSSFERMARFDDRIYSCQKRKDLCFPFMSETSMPTHMGGRIKANFPMVIEIKTGRTDFFWKFWLEGLLFQLKTVWHYLSRDRKSVV